MTRRPNVFVAAMAGLAAGVLFPAVASAATQCQATPFTGGGGPTEDQAEAEWHTQVEQKLGAEWSNIKQAKDEKVSEQNLALANAFFITAYPCRTVTLSVNPAILRTPSSALQQH